MDLLDRVGKKGGNKNSPDRMGLFQPQRRKAETLLLAWLSASLRSSRSGLDIEALRVGWVHNFNFPQYADLDIPATPAPEPGTLGLIGLGLVGLGAMKRRRRYS